MRFFILFLTILLQAGCTGIPENIRPVGNFHLNRYLGTWYEIARLDHSFERGLTNVTAEYSLREDGGVRVLNKGFSGKDQVWKTAEGKAYFVEDENRGHLKVSFFGPFYGSYVIFELDPKHYGYAFVTSYSREYLWLLARTPEVEDEVIQKFLEAARANGFEIRDIIFVEQEVSGDVVP